MYNYFKYFVIHSLNYTVLYSVYRINITYTAAAEMAYFIKKFPIRFAVLLHRTWHLFKQIIY